MFPFFKRFPKDVRKTLLELQRMEDYFSVAAAEVNGNTALVPDGQQFGKQLAALSELISKRKNSVIAGALHQMGVAKARVNIYSGFIKPIPHDTGDDSKAA